MHETHVARVRLFVADDDARCCCRCVRRFTSLHLRAAFDVRHRRLRTTEIRDLSSAWRRRRRRRRIFRQRLRLDHNSSNNAVADTDLCDWSRLLFIFLFLITVIVVVVVAVFCFRLVLRHGHQVDMFQLRQFRDDVNSSRMMSAIFAVRVFAVSSTVRRRRRRRRR